MKKTHVQTPQWDFCVDLIGTKLPKGRKNRSYIEIVVKHLHEKLGLKTGWNEPPWVDNMRNMFTRFHPCTLLFPTVYTLVLSRNKYRQRHAIDTNITSILLVSFTIPDIGGSNPSVDRVYSISWWSTIDRLPTLNLRVFHPGQIWQVFRNLRSPEIQWV